MNGEINDWVRGTDAGKWLPAGAQIIYGKDGTAYGALFDGKWYDWGSIPMPGIVTPINPPGTKAPETPEDKKDDGWDWGKFGDGFVKGFTDPFGSATQVAASWAAPWLASAVILGLAAVIGFVALQALLKSGEG